MLRTNSMLIFLISVLMVSSCIKPYDPDIQSLDAERFVVTGQVTDRDGLQKVNVSMTSPIGDPQYLPVTGCAVVITDINGMEFPMNEIGNGDYQCLIDPAFLVPGTSFMVKITTPGGEVINSDFDQLTQGPEVDSIYFVRKDIQGQSIGQIFKGIQFYIDLDASSGDSHYYRWEEIETWEYHADYPLIWYYDGSIHQVSPPDYSRKVCWSTTKVPEIYTLSTDNLVENKYNMLPIHFVNNRSSRLMYGYSLLIKQYALSEAAYIYWDQLRINSNLQGGLYAKQPIAIKGNLHNLTNPTQVVLGFFGASSLKTKRIFIRSVPDLLLNFSTLCYPDTLKRGFADFGPGDYPVYLKGDQAAYKMIQLGEECVNCLKLGGTNVKPDFWPN